MKKTNIAGLGTKVYIGVKNDGSLPPMCEMKEIDISGERSLFNSEGTDRNEHNGFSATGSFTIEKSEEDKEREEKDNILLNLINRSIHSINKSTMEHIRQKHLHGRRRKALLRHHLRTLCQYKDIALECCDIWVKIQTLDDIEMLILDTRLKMGKATRCTISMKVDGDYIPVEVVGKVVRGKFTFKSVKDKQL